ncbi:hypothetical protein SAMN02910451_02548 [Butyrivibrio hungatei]|uniref:Uncharacterized protein n=1 Tax=Butyrivibrio hungatei TaxID=185008 RepID=A0A1G5FT52_9FIRM|nr:DUF6044 family protein [Butyrivibrio hungatei]SCY42324.1 hypothetical protein SAMN02910451_02548 [Butyrivibrio hungatei]
MKQRFLRNWYFLLVIGILLLQLIVFLIAGEAHTFIGVHDNLDIHITDYKLLKDNNAFFSQGKTIPLLGGIDRNFLLSEFYAYSWLYMILPNFAAYIVGYFLKILIALFSGILLGKDILKDKYEKYKWAVVLFSFIYGLLPLYPAFSFSFASLPLLIFIIRRLKSTGKKIYYLLAFLYPTLSYFTFFGPFILGYIFIYFIYLWVKEKKINFRIFVAMILMSASYILIEYRLFALIFGSGQATIRDTMVIDDLSASEILHSIFNVFVNNIFHCEDLHRVVVLPLFIISFAAINLGHIKRKEYRQLCIDPFNLVFLFIVGNCIVYGLYNNHAVRTLFEKLVPPLKGWQFNRTIFFNPLLWYVEALIAMIRLSDHIASQESNKNRLSAILPFVPKALTIIVLLSVIGTQSLYNDFFNTCYVNTWEAFNGQKSETLSYGDFFSTDLFEKIKKDIDYKGEYSVAYGFHPAVLSYNEIATLDGCLSYYYQSYKDSFRNVIAPSLSESEEARNYYDDWGARAYIFSGSDYGIWNPARTVNVDDKRLLIDKSAFEQLNGKYVFSRIEISNEDEIGFKLIGEYSDANSPYTIWVYSL